MTRTFPIATLAAFTLAGCTHFGTNVAGQFSCRAQASQTQGAGCRQLSEVDSAAIRQAIKSGEGDVGAAREQMRQRVMLVSAEAARIGELTLKVVLPAHVDAAGLLHDEAAVWTVVEAARWAGELRRGEVLEPRGMLRALRQALKAQAQRAADAAREDPSPASAGPLPPESRAPAGANPFNPSSPRVLPSPGGEEPADVANPVPAPSATGESALSPTQHGRAPRHLEEVQHIWPSAAAIEAAKARKAKSDASASAAPQQEPR